MTLNGSEVEETHGETEEIQDRVVDDEILYRRVPRNTAETRYYNRSGRRVLVAPVTFSERAIEKGKPFAGEYRLSVDRAKLRGNSPDLTRQGVPGREPGTVRNPEEFGVVSMPAFEVWAVPGVVDIIPDPIANDPILPDNPAHALICVAYSASASKTANNNTLREVIDELAAMANRRPWEIDPPDDLT